MMFSRKGRKWCIIKEDTQVRQIVQKTDEKLLRSIITQAQNPLFQNIPKRTEYSKNLRPRLPATSKSKTEKNLTIILNRALRETTTPNSLIINLQIWLLKTEFKYKFFFFIYAVQLEYTLFGVSQSLWCGELLDRLANIDGFAPTTFKSVHHF